MSTFKVTIDLGNDAFQAREGEPRNYRRDHELIYILRDITKRLAYGGAGESDLGYRESPDGLVLISLRDHNGNHVGAAIIDPKG